jgi:hypothetical protein
MMVAFGWSADDLIAMLWAYFDESGEHDPVTGHLVRLTVGGWIASCEAWQRFDEQWQNVLEAEGISMFHMADFEAYENEFTEEKGWTSERHRRVLNQLIDIIAPIQNGLSFTNAVTAIRPNKHFTDTYETNLVDCLLHLASKGAQKYDEKISVVFAKHNDYRHPRILKIFEFMNMEDPRLGTLAVSDPIDVRPLQAADIVAYEMQQFNRDTPAGYRRYPLHRLKELGCKFRISTADSSPWSFES